VPAASFLRGYQEENLGVKWVRRNLKLNGGMARYARDIKIFSEKSMGFASGKLVRHEGALK